jgi:enamine deaminase RidA (YjgF/YER057c/UK114 family)
MTQPSSPETDPRLQLRELPRAGMRELCVTAPASSAGEVAAVVRELERTHAAQLVSAEYFGPGAEPLSPTPPPFALNWISNGYPSPGLGGAHLRAVGGAEVRGLTLGGRPVGTLLTGPYAVECMLDGLHDPDTSLSPDRQAHATFGLLEQALDAAGLDFSHVVRTWLFLDDILAWYDDFNRVRTAFFQERRVFDGLVPASTGIGAGNPWGAALLARVYAVKPLDPRVTVAALPSPLQCPALQYGSSFSRAVEVGMPDHRRLLISGPASIAPGGETVHPGDVPAQTARTCEVVAAILHSRGMDWTDVTRATVYVHRSEDREAFEQYRLSAGLPPIPVLVVHATICRHDLLFELEVDALRLAGEE